MFQQWLMNPLQFHFFSVNLVLIKIACLTVVETDCLAGYPADQHRRRHREGSFSLLTQVIPGLQVQNTTEEYRGGHTQAGQGNQRVQHKERPYPIISRCINTRASTRAETASPLHTLSHKLAPFWMKSLPYFCFTFSSTFCLTAGIFYEVRSLALQSISHLSPLSHYGALMVLNSPTWSFHHPRPQAGGCLSPTLQLWDQTMIISVASSPPGTARTLCMV